MASFNFLTSDKSGKTAKGKIEAESREAALEALRKRELRVISLQEEKAKTGLSMNLPARKKVKSKDLVIFTRQLSTMVNAGVALDRSLNALKNQTESKPLATALTDISKEIQGGLSLGDALSKHPKIFSNIYVNMVKAGEAGGILDEVLKRLALQQEKDASLRSKVKSAMAYPTVISVITVVAFIFLMTSVVPKIGNVIKNIGGEDASLPVYTQIMLSISDVMKTPFFLGGLFIVVPVAVWLFRRWKKTESGRYKWHSLLLKIPIVKVLITKVAIARFARTFSSLMGAGVSILESISTTAGAIGNAKIENELLEAGAAVKSGKQLSAQLSGSKVFPPIVAQMLAVGEETGQTDQILLKISEFYEEEVDAFVSSLSAIIEPVMIVVLGSIVGVIAASVFGPIANLSSQISG